jgi:hypothetical protein
MAKRFDHIDIPAVQFLSVPPAVTTAEPEPPKMEPEMTKPVYGKAKETPLPPVSAFPVKAAKELKRKRLNLLIQSSLYTDMEKIAHVKEISINEAISVAVREYRDREQKALELYDRFKEQV